ncbi:hypothetical protein KAW38_01025 [Candidatus Micrarchaeota archaeon]|nr:hypothetical protein [Candidatus Micrarchaeota archaeon]
MRFVLVFVLLCSLLYGANVDLTEGGNITAVNLQGNDTTQRWAGFYGNISIGGGPDYYHVLAEGENITYLDVTAKEPDCPAVGGVITGYNIINVTIYAVNESSAATPFSAGNLIALNAFMNAGTDADNASNTFTFVSTFNFSFGEVSNVPSAYTKPGIFRAGYLQDAENRFVLSATYEDDKPDWNGTTSDYQLILPVNGSLAGQTVDYWLFADVQYECIEKNTTFPEGVYYAYDAGDPHTGEGLKYNFTIILENMTANAGDKVGCWINQSDCGDHPYNSSCTRFFLNRTIGAGGINSENVSLNYSLQITDSINTSMGGNTSIYVPWEIDKCEVIDGGGTVKESYKTNWRIHVHPLNWSSADIANAFNGKSIEAQYFRNTVKADGPGDVTYSVTKYNGISVEEWCNDGVDSAIGAPGFADFAEDDTFVDCFDSDCRGITYSCLVKQAFANSSLYYSPSGSHGTLAVNIPAGDIGKEQSTAVTFSTNIWYTMHSMPDGTFKMRIRAWQINAGNSYLTTVNVEGFPDIEQVNKYAPGATANEGKLLYFIDKNSNPILTDSLGPANTRQNEVILKSFDNDQTIAKIDTTFNLSFADPGSIDMSQGYEINITVTYVQGITVYSETVSVPIYFDNESYGGSPGGKWNSTNEHEDDIWVEGVNWGSCNDTENADFDYLNCAGNEQNCFYESSYDCYDLDCNASWGPSAWNDYIGAFTYGLCGYASELLGNESCFDEYNNDWAMEDSNWGHVNPGLSLVDCRDLDCNLVTEPTPPYHRCEYGRELTCDDNFDNDMYNLLDCQLQGGGGYNDAEYDCRFFCQQNFTIFTEVGVQCDDGVDNDWDKWLEAGIFGYAINNSYGAGMDCEWGGYYGYGSDRYPDEDCNTTVMGGGNTCELSRELTCNDGFDNDYDGNAGGMPNPGWGNNPSAYLAYYGIVYVNDGDYDDYDCQFDGAVPAVENVQDSWCFDDVDNDMDAYKWTNPANFWGGGPWIVNASGGVDCGDMNCTGVQNPNNPFEMCLDMEYDPTGATPFFNNLLRNWTYCENGVDDDPLPTDVYKGTYPPVKADCDDLDCWQQFDYCGPCPDEENVSWDSCADSFDNDYDRFDGGGTDCGDTNCVGWLVDYDAHICVAGGNENNAYFCSDGADNDNDGNADCADANCNGIGACENPAEATCNDDVDNDGDGVVDCVDGDCVNDVVCRVDSTLHGTLYDEQNITVTYGGPGNQVTMTYPRRVRTGNDFLIRLTSTESFDQVKMFIGNKNGFGLSHGQGLNLAGMTKEGPDAGIFETFSYEDNAGQAVIKLWDDDHLGTTYNGFDVTIRIPTTSAYSYADVGSYKKFEYSHSINPGGATSENFPYYLILDDDAPNITRIVTEPGVKDEIVYNGAVWMGVLANDSDTANTNFHDGEIYGCYYNATGPGGYSIGETYDSNCKFNIGSMVDDGTYYVSVRARDPAGNYGLMNTTSFVVDLKPAYVSGSFSLSDVWYNISDTIDVSAQFRTDDSTVIANCQVYYKKSGGVDQLAGNLPAVVVGTDRVECSGTINAPAQDEMYELYINVTDAEGDEVSSASKVFFLCANLTAQGTGTNGEKWTCLFADMDDDGYKDSCDIPLSVRILTVYPDENMGTRDYERDTPINITIENSDVQDFIITYENSSEVVIRWYVDGAEYNETSGTNDTSTYAWNVDGLALQEYEIVVVLETLYEEVNQTWYVTLEEAGGEEDHKKKHKIEIISAEPEEGIIYKNTLVAVVIENTGNYDEKDIFVELVTPPSITGSDGLIQEIEKKESGEIALGVYPTELGEYLIKVLADNGRADDYYEFYFEVIPQCYNDSDCAEDEFCNGIICEEKRELEEDCERNAMCKSNLCDEVCIECEENGDCEWNEYCNEGMCIEIDCACGIILNHDCREYECCEGIPGYECKETEFCINNSCVPKEMDLKIIEGELIEGKTVIMEIINNRGEPVPFAHVYNEDTDTYAGEGGIARVIISYKGEIIVEKENYLDLKKIFEIIRKGFVQTEDEIYLNERTWIVIVDSKGNPIPNAVVVINRVGYTFEKEGAYITLDEYGGYIVTDEAGKLETAKICTGPMCLGKVEYQTNEKGEIYLTFSEPGEYLVQAHKDGYAIMDEGLSIGEFERMCSGPLCLGLYNIPKSSAWILWTAMVILFILNLHLLGRKYKKKKGRMLGIGILFIPILFSLPFLFGWSLYGNWLAGNIFNPCSMLDVEIIFFMVLLLWRKKKKELKGEKKKRKS